MPAYREGYYRLKIGAIEYPQFGGNPISVIEYWHSIDSFARNHNPDGWLRITDGRENAIKQVERLLRRN